MAATITPAQQIAANPRVNVWVAASAGTGKTKVLTDRLLNLMIHGSEPERILCLTFTQAAAAEMQNRLMHRLSSWATTAREKLERDLTSLLGHPPSATQIVLARQLFLKVLDTPSGIKIQTIHGFCQSLLARFPLEAHLPPLITILDENQASQLLLEARNRVLRDKDPLLVNLLQTISDHIKEFSFQDLLESLLSQRTRFRELLAQWTTPEKAEEALKEALDLPKSMDLQEPNLIPCLIEEWVMDVPFQNELLTLNAAKPHDVLSQWLAEPQARVTLFEAYSRLFLTVDGRISSRPKVKHALEAERVFTFQNHLNAISLGQKTLSLYGLCTRIFQGYQEAKLSQGKLDYDDLIEQTSMLLNQPGISSWILYKLDGGIDHILVDEAQDTNPAQWQIIRLMTEEFFTPDRLDRTLFVVGDAKQSIYSFQGANPQDFISFRTFFAERLKKGQFPWHDVDLDLSFRSAPVILDLVDRIFAQPHNQRAVLATSQEVRHLPHRIDARGHIEIWPPVLDDQESIELEPWPLPTNNFDGQSLHQKLATQVADHIEEMLQKGLYLPATKSPAEPKDILILLRKRSAVIPEIIRALKTRDIPVAGADRLILHDHIAVEDLLSLAKFALLPEDDLSLAEVLKSPLIGISEEDLFDLAHDRKSSLWQEVKKQHHSFACQFLTDLLAKVDYLSPYEWFQRALIHHHGYTKFLSRLGIEAEDVLQAFVQSLLDYQTTTGGTLQQYVDYFIANPKEIKRDSSDQQYNQVRLMTVHGSKGLQAPIVILLDHLDGREPINRILWQTNEQGHTHLMMLRPSKNRDLPLSDRLKAELNDSHEAEDKRLLYVALTRAQDHLFVGGWGKKIEDDSWYALIEGHHRSLHLPGALYQKSAPTPAPGTPAFPEWFHIPPQGWAQEKNTPAPKAEQAFSPALSRGIIIHKLLEMLGDCPISDRLSMTQQILHWYKEDLSVWEEDIALLFKLLDLPEWQPFFSPNSQAEVDIHGYLHDRPFHGRIDRLVELDEELWILDYKTTMDTSKGDASIPDLYRLQLLQYKHCLESQYPDKTIRCFILWTDKLKIVEVV